VQTVGQSQSPTVNNFPPFRLRNLSRVSFGRICAQGTVDLEAIAVDFNVVTDTDGSPAFVSPQRTKDAYSQKYCSPAKFDRDFARELLRAAITVLNGGDDSAPTKPGQPQKPPEAAPAQRATAGYSDILLESEQRFDEALDAIDDGDGAA
jgi:hypothetical protein